MNLESLVFSLTQVLDPESCPGGRFAPAPGAVTRAGATESWTLCCEVTTQSHCANFQENEKGLALTIVTTAMWCGASQREQDLCKEAALGLGLAPCRKFSPLGLA